MAPTPRARRFRGLRTRLRFGLRVWCRFWFRSWFWLPTAALVLERLWRRAEVASARVAHSKRLLS